MSEKKRIDHDHSLSISEFAKITGLNRSTLIYYDNIGLFPVHHGENRYRYYSPNQITAANMLNVLSALGVPIKTMQEMVRTRSPETAKDMLETRVAELEEKIRWMQNSVEIAKVIGSLIDEGLEADEGNIYVKELPELNIAVGDPNDWRGEKRFYNAFIKFLQISTDQGFNPCFPIGGMFDDIDGYLENSSQPERFFYIHPDGKEMRRAGPYLVGYTRGYYGVMNGLPKRMKAYANKHDIKLGGPIYNIYLFDEVSISDMDNYLMQASIPIIE
jgi:DNA-binding transcriptional MerR regulator